MEPRAMPRRIGWIVFSLFAALAAVLAARMAFWVPPPPPGEDFRAVVARVTAFEGAVRVKRPDSQDWVAVRRQMPLAAGDKIRTSSRSAAEITFQDGFVIKVDPDALMSIETPEGHVGRTAVGVDSGKVSGDAIGGGAQAQISTPAARWIGVPGERPAVDISVQSSQGTTLGQRRGSGEVASRDGTRRRLGPRSGITVAPDGTAGPIRELPAAPDLVSPQHTSTLSYPDPAYAVTRLRWTAVPGAVSYRLLVDHGGFFLQPVIDEKDIRDPVRDLAGLPEGKYYWKVVALHGDGREGTSEFARFAIVGTHAPPPPLLIEVFETRGRVLHLSGRTQPGSTATVNGQAIDIRPDGRFNEFVALPQRGPQPVVVRVTTREGGVTELTRQAEVPGRPQGDRR